MSKAFTKESDSDDEDEEAHFSGGHDSEHAGARKLDMLSANARGL